MVIAILLGVVATLHIMVPFLYAALAGLWSERAGVVNIGLEGLLLSSAFAATVGALYGGVWLGLAAAVVTNLLLSGLFAALVVPLRADPIVVGIALNLFVDAGTRFLLRALYDSTSNSPRVDSWPRFDHLHPLAIAGFLAVAATAWVLTRTAFGLRVRAAGEAPDALRAAAVSVPRIRILALLVAGVLVALGGVAIAWNDGLFVAGTAGGRGYLALAVLLIGRRQPLGVLAAAFGLAAARAFSNQMTTWSTGLPDWGIQTLPYIATLIVLGLRRKSRQRMIR